MANPLPDQAINLAAAPSPGDQPSPNALVVQDRASKSDGHEDLSREDPTTVSTVQRQSETEVSLALKILKLIDLRMDGRGSTIGAASAYLLIVVAAATAAYVIGEIRSIDGNPFICGAVFVVALFAGLLGH